MEAHKPRERVFYAMSPAIRQFSSTPIEEAPRLIEAADFNREEPRTIVHSFDTLNSLNVRISRTITKPDFYIQTVDHEVADSKMSQQARIGIAASRKK